MQHGAPINQTRSRTQPVTDRVDDNARYLFYLHGRIVEDHGAEAVSAEFGSYEYAAIVERLAVEGFTVISEVRPRNTDPRTYADGIVQQIQHLLDSGVAPSSVTVVGASKGSVIAMLVSTRLRAAIRYVLLANCNEFILQTFPVRLHGDVLSIYEESDELGQTCRPLFDRSPDLGRRREVQLATGLRHGFIFRPLDLWVRPTVAWARDGAGRTASHLGPADAPGVWEGAARVGEAILPLTVTLERRDGGWTGTVDVPSQYALSFPLTDVRIDGTTVAFSFSDLLPPGVFKGQWAGGRIHGAFTSPLGSDTLDGTFELRRRPASSAPYSTESVRFRNGELELAGTIFRPHASGPLPAVVFVHGSGPQTRDSYIRWFADQFARAGFVTLIYDKRGAGESGGDPWPRTAGSFADLADDAVAAVRFLHAHPAVDAARIGVWGLSQGAWIAPLAASRSSNLVRFLMLISGGGVRPAEQELYDDEIKLRDLGFDEASIDAALAYLRLADEYVRTGSDEDWERFAIARDDARRRQWYSHLDRFPQMLPREAPVWAGLRADLDYDPAPVLNGIPVPVLLILGEEDRLTPANETAVRVRRALESGGNLDVTVRVLQAADHALLVKPSRHAPWLADRPAGNWIAEMLDWATRHR